MFDTLKKERERDIYEHDSVLDTLKVEDRYRVRNDIKESIVRFISNGATGNYQKRLQSVRESFSDVIEDELISYDALTENTKIDYNFGCINQFKSDLREKMILVLANSKDKDIRKKAKAHLSLKEKYENSLGELDLDVAKLLNENKNELSTFIKTINCENLKKEDIADVLNDIR